MYIDSRCPIQDPQVEIPRNMEICVLGVVELGWSIVRNAQRGVITCAVVKDARFVPMVGAGAVTVITTADTVKMAIPTNRKCKKEILRC